jgi:hypothetical protein
VALVHFTFLGFEMTAGLEIYNDAGALIIDSVNPNYSLLASGTASTGVAVSFTTTTVRPLVFVRFNTSNRFVRVADLTNSSVTFACYDQPASSTAYATEVSGSTEYMVFGIASTLAPSSPGYGLNVFDAAGNLIYDSNRVVPRVKEVVTLPALSPPTVTYNPISVIAHSQGSNPWMLANSTYNPYGYVFHDDNPAHLSYLLCTALRSSTASGNQIWLEAVKVYTIGTQGSSWPSAPTQVALIP